MERLLVLTAASDKDPSLSSQKIDGVLFPEYFRRQGIKVLKEELIASCHGNTAYSLKAAEQMQELAEQGHRVVAIESGGLYFARPSLEAVHATTVPIISVPLGGLDAFLAPNLPAGVAAVGGVSPANYKTAAQVAKEILLKEFTGVYVWGKQSTRLDEAISKLNLEVLGTVHPSGPKSVDGLLIGEVHPTDFKKFEDCTPLGIYSAAVNPNYLMRESEDMEHSVYVRGPENLAYFAAKIISLNNRVIKFGLKKARDEKRDTYKEPNLTIESFG